MMTNADVERAQQPGRGRRADAPAEIPARGWKDVLVRTFKEIMQDRVTFVAAGATYFLLLAIFPTLTALVSIYGLVADTSTVQQHVALLTGLLPEGGLALLEEQLERLASQGAPTLGIALAGSLVVALWSSSAGVKALFEAMNIAYDEEEKRGFIALTVTALLFTLAGIIGAVVMLMVVVAMPIVLGFLGLGGAVEWLVRIGSYALLVGLLMVGLAALYRFGPSRQQAKWRWITPGAIVATAAILVMSLLFSWYAANFANYERTYGSLGALIAFLTWVWLSVTLVIVGAELNAEVEHQTAKDSTVGADEPLGQREATMADTVGASAEEGGEDDDLPEDAGKSAEWRAGYAAGLKRRGAPRPSLPLVAAVPAALALDALRKHSERQRH